MLRETSNYCDASQDMNHASQRGFMIAFAKICSHLSTTSLYLKYSAAQILQRSLVFIQQKMEDLAQSVCTNALMEKRLISCTSDQKIT